MTEAVRNDASTESLCTVIENFSGNSSSSNSQIINPSSNLGKCADNRNNITENVNTSLIENNLNSNKSLEPKKIHKSDNDEADKSLYETCDTSQDEAFCSKSDSVKPSKLKKSVSFDPQDEKVRKFIAGEPIVDQKNPFKQHYSTWGNSVKKKKTPPPVPAKRSTLSVRKTVTQQLREREREKEKERERIKNETNNRKSNSLNTNLTSPDDFVTTEEVLNQSKYVKTYIKNPDPYFVYDPSILARLKCEESRELAEKKSGKKPRFSNQTKDRIKDLKSKTSLEASFSHSRLPFKKCSKPNYPDLSDIKIKVGTDLDGNFFNPAEVSKNAKKFDDRVKKLHISSDDDLDELDCPLTKSESSDEVTSNLAHKEANNEDSKGELSEIDKMASKEDRNGGEQPVEGSFTNTIKSREFHEYLEKKGLTLIPKKIPNGARSVYSNGIRTPKPQPRISFKSPENVQISVDTTDAARNYKKPSVFQRLLSNSIFATRRKTTPKDIVPTPKSLNNYSVNIKENSDAPQSSLKRVVLERQSFHGRPTGNNLLSPAETNYLKLQNERARKSFASGENISLSLSSVLTNAEDQNLTGERDDHTPSVKPPRRTQSRERLGSTPHTQLQNQSLQATTIIKPRPQRLQSTSDMAYMTPKGHPDLDSDVTLKRSVEHQSFIPKRSTQTVDRRQVFGRSASMDRNEILKKRLLRELQNRSKSDNETSKMSTPLTSRENIREQPFSTLNGPKSSSTPIRNTNSDSENQGCTQNVKSSNKIYVDQQEWERLKALKERTDNELYLRMFETQNQQQRAAENIYERLQPQQIIITQPTNLTMHPTSMENNFIRGSPQRNTFAGSTKNRQAKIIDGRALMPSSQFVNMHSTSNINQDIFECTPRSQSVLDNMTLAHKYAVNMSRETYENELGTPVVLRRKQTNATTEAPHPVEQRRIGGLLTRDEILQKVKDFCRKSISKTPTIQQPQLQVMHKSHAGPSDLSPVSYASVEGSQRPTSRIYAAPQVPQRMQSLPQQFIPINSIGQVLGETNPLTSSPLYAHVVKRSSLLSSNSEIYDSPQKLNLVRRDVETTPAIYVEHGSMPTPQYVFVDADKLVPAAQVFSYYPGQNDIYAQPHYVRPCNLQSVPGSYGYISVREPLPKQQLPQRLHNGRSTPLILDHSSQQTSQIYWTPNNQRLQSYITTLQAPVNLNSPRYVLKQFSPVPAHRVELSNNPNVKTNSNTTTNNNIQLSTKTNERRTPTNRQNQMKLASGRLSELHNQNPYEWESGSEAGEVQRIMENPRSSD